MGHDILAILKSEEQRLMQEIESMQKCLDKIRSTIYIWQDENSVPAISRRVAGIKHKKFERSVPKAQNRIQGLARTSQKKYDEILEYLQENVASGTECTTKQLRSYFGSRMQNWDYVDIFKAMAKEGIIEKKDRAREFIYKGMNTRIPPDAILPERKAELVIKKKMVPDMEVELPEGTFEDTAEPAEDDEDDIVVAAPVKVHTPIHAQVLPERKEPITFEKPMLQKDFYLAVGRRFIRQRNGPKIESPQSFYLRYRHDGRALRNLIEGVNKEWVIK